MFAKFATALCVARVISAFELHLYKNKDLIISALLVLTPMVLIVLQRETGSALVYFSFFLMFYREGMPGSFKSLSRRIKKRLKRIECCVLIAKKETKSDPNCSKSGFFKKQQKSDCRYSAMKIRVRSCGTIPMAPDLGL